MVSTSNLNDWSQRRSLISTLSGIGYFLCTVGQHLSFLVIALYLFVAHKNVDDIAISIANVIILISVRSSLRAIALVWAFSNRLCYRGSALSFSSNIPPPRYVCRPLARRARCKICCAVGYSPTPTQWTKRRISRLGAGLVLIWRPFRWWCSRRKRNAEDLPDRLTLYVLICFSEYAKEVNDELIHLASSTLVMKLEHRMSIIAASCKKINERQMIVSRIELERAELLV